MPSLSGPFRTVNKFPSYACNSIKRENKHNKLGKMLSLRIRDRKGYISFQLKSELYNHSRYNLALSTNCYFIMKFIVNYIIKLVQCLDLANWDLPMLTHVVPLAFAWGRLYNQIPFCFNRLQKNLCYSRILKKAFNFN